MTDDPIRDATIAWINAISEHWEDIYQRTEGDQREVFDRATAMAKEDSPENWDLICGPVHPPVYATVRPLKGIRDPWIDPPKYAVAVQYLICDCRPFWAHYLPFATEEFERMKAKK